jgi:hypothetical protein
VLSTFGIGDLKSSLRFIKFDFRVYLKDAGLILENFVFAVKSRFDCLLEIVMIIEYFEFFVIPLCQKMIEHLFLISA